MFIDTWNCAIWHGTGGPTSVVHGPPVERIVMLTLPVTASYSPLCHKVLSASKNAKGRLVAFSNPIQTTCCKLKPSYATNTYDVSTWDVAWGLLKPRKTNPYQSPAPAEVVIWTLEGTTPSSGPMLTTLTKSHHAGSCEGVHSTASESKCATSCAALSAGVGAVELPQPSVAEASATKEMQQTLLTTTFPRQW
jgi:hypothetical protein